jgi:hypothetical protein
MSSIKRLSLTQQRLEDPKDAEGSIVYQLYKLIASEKANALEMKRNWKPVAMVGDMRKRIF